MRHIIAVIVLGAAGAPGLTAAEKPLLHPIFSEHMVFPRDVAVPVWGWTAPGQAVSVSLGERSARTAAGPDGRWEVALGPFRAGGLPLTLKVVAGGAEKSAADILVGDVWICSGQSNMEWPVIRSRDAKAEVAAATQFGIRLFTVPKKIACAPELLCEGTWKRCSPESVAEFSAVGYFFGRELERDEHIPIGLINSSWGGTVAEAWVSAGALRPLGDFDAAIEGVEAMAGRSEAEEEKRFWDNVGKWMAANDPAASAGNKWSAPDFADQQWPTIEQPAQWEAAGLNFDGIVWMRREFDLPDGWDGKPARLDLGVVDEVASAWVNGQPLESTPRWRARRVYDVPAGALRRGRNVVAVRVLDVQGGGGMLPTPDGLRITAREAAHAPAPVPLAGPWRYQTGKPIFELPPFPPRLTGNPNLPTVLSNGMIEPLVPFPVKGAIWYQGESNASRAGQYRALLPALITDWRRRFHNGDFPFLIVQLANFRGRDAEPPPVSEWAELREAQASTARKLPNCGLAVAIDIGEENDIHPRNKQDVGKRLALEARRIAYGERLESQGPTFESMRVEGRSIRIKFSHAEGGLVVSGGGPEVKGFAVAGRDGRLAWAHGTAAGSEVTLSVPDGIDPVAVRYAWGNNPEVNLVNTAGLPAAPFRTDPPAR